MPAATTTLVPESVIPELLELTKVVVICEALIKTPFRVSFDNTFVKEVPPIEPSTEIPISLTASIGARCNWNCYYCCRTICSIYIFTYTIY